MWKIAGIGLLLLAAQAYGSENVGCKARHQAVTEQLSFARAHDNAQQVCHHHRRAFTRYVIYGNLPAPQGAPRVQAYQLPTLQLAGHCPHF